MKKELLIIALAGVVLTSCDPLKAEGDFDVKQITEQNILEGATFKQYNAIKDENGNVTYEPCENGNVIEYNLPNVQAVNIYYINKSGDKKILTYGRSGGMFTYQPARGSDPVQTLYFAFTNIDGTEVVAEKQFTLQPAQELEPAVALLVSDDGSKVWRWMATTVNDGGAVWGNGGYCAGPQDGSDNINGAWWGCGVEDGNCKDKFSGQTKHAGGKYDQFVGQTYALSSMVFNEDGSVMTYSPEGVEITSGTFSVTNFKNNEITNDETSSRGTLNTSAGSILWPFAINKDGMMPEQFEIGWLDAGRLILLYADPGTGAWGECTWWSFKSGDDPQVLASHDWHWKPTNVNVNEGYPQGGVWGNGGYLAGAQSGDGSINGAWWGCGINDGECKDTFSGQTTHAGGQYDKYEGDTYAKSKMVFNVEDLTVTVFDQNGNQTRQGSFALDLTPNPSNFSVGTLNTSAGAILWPFAINTDGMQPTSFEVGYLGPDGMVLIYAAPGSGAWGECTWWSFGK